MPVSNGYRFSDCDGRPVIPRLCDPITDEYIEMYRESNNPDNIYCCDTCDYTESDVEYTFFPAVIRERGSDHHYGYYDIDEDPRLERAPEAVTIIHVKVCPDCYKYCEQIMKTSDHIAQGFDWWDMVDSLTESIKKIKREHFDWRKTKPVKDTIRAAIQIFVAKTGPFSDMPTDIIIHKIIPHLIQSYKDSAAMKIQYIWKDYYHRIYKNTETVTFHNCDDCGRKRCETDLCYKRSCLACPHECCTKRICKDSCCNYLCPNCEGSNIVSRAWSNHQGEKIYEDCRWCNVRFELPIKWHGPRLYEAGQSNDDVTE